MKLDKNQLFVDLGNGVQMEFLHIPSGEFWMGADKNDKQSYENERPKHKVYLDDYYIGIYHVTVLHYGQFVQDENYFSYPIKYYEDNNPIVEVTWIDAFFFCECISHKSGLSVRLPTELNGRKQLEVWMGVNFLGGTEDPIKG